MIRFQDIRVRFYGEGSGASAVDGVDLEMPPAAVLAIVGESGSGKSTLAMAIGGLISPDEAMVAGRIVLPSHGEYDLSDHVVRPGLFGYVFQEPAVCLHPSMRVGAQVAEAWQTGYQRLPTGEELIHLFERVRLRDPASLLRRFPHELSGGMQQRVMIAMALAQKPAVLVADEPTTALDPITQMQVLETILEVVTADNLALLLITHDFGIVSRFATHVAVLEQGKLVEQGMTPEVLQNPRHPASRRLIAAVPRRRNGAIHIGLEAS